MKSLARWLVATVALIGCHKSTATDPSSASRADAHSAPIAAHDAGALARPVGPTGSVEGTVFLGEALRPAHPIVVDNDFRTHAGCRDAAIRYAQPFDVTQPGPFPGALVSAEAHSPAVSAPRERRLDFGDCDIRPRAIFVNPPDRIFFHADTHLNHLPHIVGGAAAIDRVLIPGQSDVEVHLPGPGRFPVMMRDLPMWAQSLLFVLPNRFIDTTDLQGHFRISDIPVGNVLVHAWYPGAVEAREVVAIRAGEVAHVEFRLRQAPEPPPPASRADAGPIPP